MAWMDQNGQWQTSSWCDSIGQLGYLFPGSCAPPTADQIKQSALNDLGPSATVGTKESLSAQLDQTLVGYDPYAGTSVLSNFNVGDWFKGLVGNMSWGTLLVVGVGIYVGVSLLTAPTYSRYGR